MKYQLSFETMSSQYTFSLLILIFSFVNNYAEVANFTLDSLEFNHMTVHDITGDVYIGGVDYIHRLDEDLLLISNITTKPDDETDNYNKILSINYNDNNLVTCGSDKGWCQIRNLTDLSVLGDSDKYVAAPNVEDSTVGFVAPGYDDKPMLYVGTSKRGLVYDGVEAVSGRQLEEALFHTIFESQYKQTAVGISSIYHGEYFVIYIQGFSYDGFSYFLVVQKLYRSDNSYITRIVRVCQERDDNYYQSYTEVTLQCDGRDSTSYNLLQAAHVMRPASDLVTSLSLEDGEHVLFAVFAKGETPQDLTPLQQSAVCMYKMTDIEQAFTDAISGCVDPGGDDYELYYIQGSTCPGTVHINVQEECSTGGLYRYANGKDPVFVNAVLEYPNTLLTSIAVTIVQEHTVGFIGTQDGHILKVHFQSSSSANEYSNENLATSTILSDMVFDNNMEHLNVLTEHTVYKVKVQDCNQYTTCSECFDSMDPYCGWCTLERRCSLYSDCPLSDQTSRWLDVFSDDTCVNITSIEPTDSIPITVQNQIVLNVAELPDERDISPAYECIYENGFERPANQSGQSLSCDTPPTNQRPDIPSDQDHVSVQLLVKSYETNVNFVNTSFYFFECSNIKTCTECVSSNWACDWCIYENRCTHESDTCVQDDNSTIVFGVNNIFTNSMRRGDYFCPHLEQQDDEVLIPVDLTSIITISAVNLPELKGNPGYECILRGEGFEDFTPATRHNDSTLICNDKKYNYDANVQELNVSLTVQWNDNYIIDDIYGFIVTLYNCSVGRHDCSECLSTVTTREELQCGWCVSDTSCKIDEHCNQEWLQQESTVKCDDPIINAICPSSGSFEGGTEVIITGSNLGKDSSRIGNVTIGGHPCEVIKEKYVVARSLECTTESAAVDYSGTITVSVIGNDNTTQTGTSDDSVQFTWRNQSVVDFHPKIGPKSGGTTVIISGQYMDAGRNITVDIGGSICTVDRERCMTNQNIDQDNMWMNMVNETHIICSSGANEVTDAANLTIYFDGAVRPLFGVTYEYAEDPTIETISPESSMVSGGRMIEVTGSYFTSIQKPLLIINSPPEDPYQSEPCDVLSNDHMVCITPEINYLLSRSRRASTCVDNCTDVTIGFKMDGVEDLLSLPDFSFKIFDDPEYFMFQEKDNIKVFEGEQLAIDGKNLNLASTAQEVFVYIGTERCNVTSLAVNQLNCNPPNSQPKGVDINGTATKNKLPEVRVRVGVLEFFIGYVEYPEDDLPIEVIAAVAAAALLLLIILIVVCIVCQRRHTNERLTVEKTKQKMESVELAIRDKLKVAFTELQTMMPEMSDIGASASIPFLSFNDYVVNMIFAGQTDHPVFLKGTVDASSNLAKGLRRFHNLLKEKKFLVVFIHTLEEERNISVRDRVNIGSLLTLALHKERHMAYLTDVLKTLLADAAEFAVEDESVKGMLRRTESVMEKMLTNWYVLNLYPFLKNCCGASIYWLCEALKQQIQIGPVDAIEYRAKYSLNDEYLMREDITHNVLTITVLTDDSSSELKAKVLDIDTVTQVKEKLLDVIYKSTGIPFSKRPSVDEVDLEWRHGRKLEGRLVLQDEDVTTIIEGRWKKINTMRNYKIPTDATMTLVKKSETANGNKQLRSPISAMNIHNEKELQDSEAASDMASSRLHRVKTNRRYEDAEGGVRSYHLLKCKTPSGNENKIQKGNFRERALTRARTFYRQRVISEVFLLQLVSTKGTIEQFLLNAFNKLLRVGEQSEQFPSAIKYMFDYLDELSNRHSINDPDVAHIWKSNSLLLKLWPNILKYPQNIFDMWVPEIVTPSLDIISQTFIDACSKMERKLGTKTPANRLLYAKEIEDYKAELVKYFHDIREMPKITDQQMEAALSEDFVSLNSTFEELTVLNELYNYASKYGDKLLDALEQDEQCREHRFAFQLEQIASTMAEVDYN